MIKTLYFKIKGSYLFSNDVGYVSVKNIDNTDYLKYRKIVAEQSCVNIENVIPIDKNIFDKNTNKKY